MVVVFVFSSNLSELMTYVLVRLDGIKASGDVFGVVPRSWMLTMNTCYYPITKMSSCAMEKLVELAVKPQPVKSFKRQAIQHLHDSGETLKVQDYPFHKEGTGLNPFYLPFVCVFCLENLSELLDLLDELGMKPEKAKRKIEVLQERRKSGEETSDTCTGSAQPSGEVEGGVSDEMLEEVSPMG